MVQYSMRQNDNKTLVHLHTGIASDTNDVATDDDTTLTPEEQNYRDTVIPLLLIRAYHLPNNSYFQDLYQYMCNNHPVFGILLHHKYHPIQRTIRIISLIGSMLFGLAITNIIYLAFVFADTDYDKAYVEVTIDSETGATTGNTFVDNTVPALSLTNGNIALWTIGAMLHASFDNLIWSLAACSCCTTSTEGLTEKKLARYRNTGVVLVVLSVVIATGLATFAVALRAAISSSNSSNDAAVQVDPDTVHSYGLTDDNVQLFQVDAKNDFEFLIAYFIELVLNYFIYYPVIGTILFSGILTCGRYGGVFGGRPLEIKMASMTEADKDEGIRVSTTTFQPSSSLSDVEQPKRNRAQRSKQ
jgi:hypothetical protein